MEGGEKGMLGKPKFIYGDKVKFLCEREAKIGIIQIVDAYGTFFQNMEPSYDIMVGVGEKRCLYKHINESLILAKSDDENEILNIVEAKKDIYFLKNWYFSLERHEDKAMWQVHGNSYNNPKFQDGLKICTSNIKKISIGSFYIDVYTLNSIYRCLFCESNEKSFKFIDDNSLFDKNISKNELNIFIGNIINEVKCAKLNEQEKILEAIHNKEECLVMVFSDLAEYYFKEFVVKTNDKISYYGMHPHSGMYQDSVLITSETCDTNNSTETIDFRYFPYKGNRISFYRWEGYSGYIYAINQGKSELEIDTPSGKFLLHPNGNAYLISVDSTEGRIQNPIAPPIDLHSVWDANVDADGRVSYGMPRNETEQDSRK